MILRRSGDFTLFPNFDEERQKFCNQMLVQKPTHLFLNIAWEAVEFEHYILSVDEFLYAQGISTTWIITNWSKNNPGWKQLKCPVVFFDYFLWRSYNEIVNKKKSDLNPRWNSDANKYLFLTGKPDRFHRIGLLYLLHSSGLTNCCTNSLFMHEGLYEQCKALLPLLSSEQFNNFVDRYRGTPDNATPVMQPTSMHYGGIPYDCKMYANSLFRLISETSIDLPRPWITEKTWLTIANKSPFVIAAEPYSCRYLQSIGLETFDQMFETESYDNFPAADTRLFYITKHVEHWLGGDFSKTKVNDMVEHNFDQFIKLARQAKQEFEDFANCDIDLAIDTTDDITGF